MIMYVDRYRIIDIFVKRKFELHLESGSDSFGNNYMKEINVTSFQAVFFA